MANIGPQVSKNVKNRVIEKCWDYLDRHFANLNEHNKLKVILTICPKDMPTQLNGDALKAITNIVINNPKRIKPEHRSDTIPV